jgi:hypothetical protein
MDTLEKIIIPLIGIVVSAAVAFLTTIQVLKKELNNGKVLLLEIIKRYIINVTNSLNVKDLPVEVKKDKESKLYYLSELDSIDKDLGELFTNPLLIKIFKKHTDLTMLAVSLRRELVYLKQNETILSINQDTLRYFLKLFDVVKKEYGKEKFEKDHNLKAINDMVDYLKKQINYI